MAAAFLDTSVVVRRYVRSEPGAQRVRGLCLPSRRNTILLTRITSVEVAPALARKARDGALRLDERSRIWRLFMVHWRNQYQITTISETTYEQAERLLFNHPLRAYDALQLAGALEAQAALPNTTLQFWTADRQQASAAQAEGLQVELIA